jgi:hypothetical protein
MSLSGKLIVHVLLVLVLSARVSSAAAAPATGDQVDAGPASFNIRADQCPRLPAGEEQAANRQKEVYQ